MTKTALWEILWREPVAGGGIPYSWLVRDRMDAFIFARCVWRMGGRAIHIRKTSLARLT